MKGATKFPEVHTPRAPSPRAPPPCAGGPLQPPLSRRRYYRARHLEALGILAKHPAEGLRSWGPSPEVLDSSESGTSFGDENEFDCSDGVVADVLDLMRMIGLRTERHERMSLVQQSAEEAGHGVGAPGREAAQLRAGLRRKLDRSGHEVAVEELERFFMARAKLEGRLPPRESLVQQWHLQVLQASQVAELMEKFRKGVSRVRTIRSICRVSRGDSGHAQSRRRRRRSSLENLKRLGTGLSGISISENPGGRSQGGSPQNALQDTQKRGSFSLRGKKDVLSGSGLDWISEEVAHTRHQQRMTDDDRFSLSFGDALGYEPLSPPSQTQEGHFFQEESSRRAHRAHEDADQANLESQRQHDAHASSAARSRSKEAGHLSLAGPATERPALQVLASAEATSPTDARPETPTSAYRAEAMKNLAAVWLPWPSRSPLSLPPPRPRAAQTTASASASPSVRGGSSKTPPPEADVAAAASPPPAGEGQKAENEDGKDEDDERPSSRTLSIASRSPEPQAVRASRTSIRGRASSTTSLSRRGSRRLASSSSPVSSIKLSFSDMAEVTIRQQLLNTLPSFWQKHGDSSSCRSAVLDRYLQSCEVWQVKPNSTAVSQMKQATVLRTPDGRFEVVYNLAHARIGDRGVVCVLEALSLDPQCVDVCLKACNLRSQSGGAVAAFLELHPSLRRLDLADNPFSLEAGEQILEALNRRSTGQSFKSILARGSFVAAGVAGLVQLLPRLREVTVELGRTGLAWDRGGPTVGPPCGNLWAKAGHLSSTESAGSGRFTPCSYERLRHKLDRNRHVRYDGRSRSPSPLFWKSMGKRRWEAVSALIRSAEGREEIRRLLDTPATTVRSRNNHLRQTPLEAALAMIEARANALSEAEEVEWCALP